MCLRAQINIVINANPLLIFLLENMLLTAVAYLCVIAVQHILSHPHGEINTCNFPVLVPFNMVVCCVIIE